MKIYPNMKKTLLIFLGFSILILFVFYATFGGSFTWPPKTSDYILFAGWFIITAVYFVITLRMGYYTLEKDALYQRRLTKEFCYPYKEIIYIDEEWSRKNKILFFVTDRGTSIYLIMDKKQVLLEEMLKRCPKLLNKEEVQIRFPNVKL